MRIIGGEWRGRSILSVNGKNTRPTTDRVKESIFNIIQAYIEDSNVLDLFAGTGNLGLEALSRGAKKAIFVDSDHNSTRIIKENVNSLKCQDRGLVIRKNVSNVLENIEEEFDIIFMDPPYMKNQEIITIQSILSHNLLALDGIIIVEHSKMDKMPETIDTLKRIKHRNYGNTSISIYGKGQKNDNG